MKSTGKLAFALLCLIGTASLQPLHAEEAATPAASAAPRPSNQFNWRGDVDGVIEVSLRHRSVRTHVVSGRSMRRGHQHYRVYGFLPARPVEVRLEHIEGTGTVEIVQQPEQANNFTAVVRVANSDPGRSETRFRLAW